jgi:ribonuclease HI
MTEQALRKPLKSLITNKNRITDVELVLEQIDASATRSEIRALIESLSFLEEEKISVREWLDSVYICSIAETYNAIAVELPRSSVQRLAQRKTTDESKLLLSVESIERLARVRIATFEIIYDRTRDDARKWRENRKGRHIKHLASTVDRDTTTDSAVRRERVKSAFRLAFVAVVLQLSSAFDLSNSRKVGLAVVAVIATDFLPVLYRNAFPKGRLTAVIDPIGK